MQNPRKQTYSMTSQDFSYPWICLRSLERNSSPKGLLLRPKIRIKQEKQNTFLHISTKAQKGSNIKQKTEKQNREMSRVTSLKCPRHSRDANLQQCEGHDRHKASPNAQSSRHLPELRRFLFAEKKQRENRSPWGFGRFSLKML